jgi:hypothetical protein
MAQMQKEQSEQRLVPEYHIKAFDYSKYQMLLSQQCLDVVLGRGCAWAPEYTTDGIDNTVYPGGMVPFKFTALNGQQEDHHVLAAKYYAMAHRRGNVEGPPVAIAVVNFPADEVLAAILEKTLTLIPDQCTLGFMKKVARANYPGMKEEVKIYPISPEGQISLLNLGLAFLGDL